MKEEQEAIKRKPIRKDIKDVSGEIDGISFIHAVFETEPFDTVEEYRQFRATNENFSCLRTKKDWDMFFLKLDDRNACYKHLTAPL